MGRKEELITKIQELMWIPDQIRNMGIVAHIDHGKTTLSDNLLLGSGLISEELAGEKRSLDFDPQEQARGITINAANISLVHTLDGKDFLINLIDTPGHVDFGGEVIRATRAVDGGLIVVDAVESVMPQTETVLRQALRERVRPILFINKVDRLIRELKLSPEEMQQRFIKVIEKVNDLIRRNAPEEFKTAWQVRVEDGSVMFGSAYHRWALSFPHMKALGMTLKTVIDAYTSEEEWKKLGRMAPLHKTVFDMAIKHFPNPKQAQQYRIKQIWPGEDEEMRKKLSACDPNGPFAFMITKIIIDPNAGEITTGRLYSGTIVAGMDVYLCGVKQKVKVQQLGIYMGAEKVRIEKAPAGNIIAIIGLKGSRTGDTACDPNNPIVPFETIQFAEPVVTEAIEAKNTKDLPKLIEVLHDIEKADPTIHVEIDNETGEHKLSGMGELHLEIWKYRIEKERGVAIESSQPIVVFRETIGAKSPEVEGKSPNKHNKFYITVEPLEENVIGLIKAGTIRQGEQKKENLKTIIAAGVDRDEAKKLAYVSGTNALYNFVKGEVHIGEVMELVTQGFEDVVKKSPLTDEKCHGLKVKLTDVTLHEDAIHRGPAQVIPAVRNAIKAAMLMAQPFLLEPKQNIFLRVPEDYVGAANSELSSRRGQILDMKQEGDTTEISGKVPVAEMFGFSNGIRSATQGRVLWSTENAGFERLPAELQRKIVTDIRKRKGMKETLPTPQDYIE
ncbi:TPA: elongation factor EF-2 [archaeon]|nr:elongation factor EF-2 [Candidatus Naiadarchaeales archaeon SRR2090159.bin1288]